MKQIRCDNCGEYLGTLPTDHADFQAPSKGGIAYRGGLIGRIKYFCNDDCKKTWKNKNDNSSNKNNNSSNNSSLDSGNDIEKARLEWEKEQVRKQEEAEEKAKKEAKAKELKEQGKPFMAFVAENQDNITIGVLFLFSVLLVIFAAGGAVIGILASVVIGGVLGFGIYKYFKEMFKK